MVVAFEWRDDQWSLVQPLIYGLVFAGLMQTAMSGFGLYDEREQRFRLTMQRVLSAYLVTLAVAAVLFYLFADVMVRRGVFAVASMVALLAVLAVRYMAHRAAAMQVPTRPSSSWETGRRRARSRKCCASPAAAGHPVSLPKCRRRVSVTTTARWTSGRSNRWRRPCGNAGFRKSSSRCANDGVDANR